MGHGAIMTVWRNLVEYTSQGLNRILRQPLSQDMTISLRDYAAVGRALFWQRQVSFIIALAVGAIYFNPRLALASGILVLSSEVFDAWCFRRLLAEEQAAKPLLRWRLLLIYLGTVLSAGMVAFYAVWISIGEVPGNHFVPLFLLFAASLFAAMHNHQIISVISLRLAIYGATFLAIPIRDLVSHRPGFDSPLWTQLITAIIVFYFMVECARAFRKLYITQRRQIEALRVEHEQAMVASRAKSDFLSIVSHELRTPMTSILGSVILARSGKLGQLPERIDKILGIAQSNCARLADLINDVLDLQKIEAGKMTFAFEEINLQAFVQSAIAMNAPYGERFRVNYVPELPAEPIYVSSDRNRLNQVLANLLSNAAKFSFEGGAVTVRIDADTERVRILVIDRGVGLAEAHRKLVFDEFSQVESPDIRRSSGTGLGMNISKRLMESLGGTIDYVKNDGPGTTFFIELQRIPAPAATRNSLAA